MPMPTPHSPLMELARIAARAVLENGGEIYRVEETVRRILSVAADAQVDVLALPTGVFMSLITPQGAASTVLRVHTRSMNLSRLDEANRISRALVEGALDVEEATARLRELCRPEKAPAWRNMMAAAISAACFTVLFAGDLRAFLVAILDGIAVEALSRRLSGEDYFILISSLLGGMLAALIALCFRALMPTLSIQAIIAGAIFPLLPGLTMTNAMRDIMRGDLVSGIARLGEVLLVALSLAGGIYLALKLWSLGGGAVGMG